MRSVNLFYIALILSMATCKQAAVLTSAERMAQTLHQVVEDKNIRTASVIVLPSGSAYFNGDNSVSFTGSFARIGESYWNLDKLVGMKPTSTQVRKQRFQNRPSVNRSSLLLMVAQPISGVAGSRRIYPYLNHHVRTTTE